MIYNTDSDDTLNRSIELNELNELNELEEFDMKYVIKKHEYSKNNYLYIYNIGIRICRVGVFVSDYINNVNFISCSKNDQDRILYIEYVNDNGDVRKEEISCGVMSDLEYNIIKKLIYEYVRL